MWHLSEQIHQTTLEQREQSTAACCAKQSGESGMQSSRSFAPFDEIVLASGSPRRREILQALGVPVTVRTFDTPRGSLCTCTAQSTDGARKVVSNDTSR